VHQDLAERIHEASLSLLESEGVRFEHDFHDPQGIGAIGARAGAAIG